MNGCEIRSPNERAWRGRCRCPGRDPTYPSKPIATHVLYVHIDRAERTACRVNREFTKHATSRARSCPATHGDKISETSVEFRRATTMRPQEREARVGEEPKRYDTSSECDDGRNCGRRAHCLARRARGRRAHALTLGNDSFRCPRFGPPVVRTNRRSIPSQHGPRDSAKF